MGNFDYEIKDYGAKYHKEKAPIVKAARPFRMIHKEKSEIVILCCHGFTGYPGELARPAIDLFDAGFDVYVPRYPGHGTSGEDFSQTDGAMWLNTILDCYDDIKKDYKKVFLVGHSMGGLIASIVATKKQVERVVLFAPAFTLKSPIWLAKLLKPIKKRTKTKWKQDKEYPFYYEGDETDDEVLGAQYWAFNYLKQVCELDKLRKRAIKEIKNMDSQVLTFIGDKDNAVSPEACRIVGRNNQGLTVSKFLEGATHLIPYDKCEETREEANKLCVEWFLQEKIEVE